MQREEKGIAGIEGQQAKEPRQVRTFWTLHTFRLAVKCNQHKLYAAAGHVEESNGGS